MFYLAREAIFIYCLFARCYKLAGPANEVDDIVELSGNVSRNYSYRIGKGASSVGSNLAFIAMSAVAIAAIVELNYLRFDDLFIA